MAHKLTPGELLSQLERVSNSWLSTPPIEERMGRALESKKTRELWKYTTVTPFLEDFTRFKVCHSEIGGLHQAGIVSYSMSTGGSWDTGAQADTIDLQNGPADTSSASRFPLADLALLMTGDLIVVRINESLSEPLEITRSNGLHVPILIELAVGVEARLIERNPIDTDSGANISNHSLYIRLAQRSKLTHARTALCEDSCDWSLTRVHLADASHYQLQQYLSGGNRRRSETQVILAGRDARADLVGAYVVNSDTHLDQQILIEHRSPGTISRQKFHGIGAGKGRATFNGRIHIHPKAPGSDATLSNRNLALHPQAEINTKPELEIYTDDVKCAHGATIGQQRQTDEIRQQCLRDGAGMVEQGGDGVCRHGPMKVLVFMLDFPLLEK